MIDYIQADDLALETDLCFDLICLIYCNLCALAPQQRHLCGAAFDEDSQDMAIVARAN